MSTSRSIRIFIWSYSLTMIITRSPNSSFLWSKPSIMIFRSKKNGTVTFRIFSWPNGSLSWNHRLFRRNMNWVVRTSIMRYSRRLLILSRKSDQPTTSNFQSSTASKRLSPVCTSSNKNSREISFPNWNNNQKLTPRASNPCSAPIKIPHKNPRTKWNLTNKSKSENAKKKLISWKWISGK